MFMQRYSGSDLHGVTAKVVDMPHHCMLFFSNPSFRNSIKFFTQRLVTGLWHALVFYIFTLKMKVLFLAYVCDILSRFIWNVFEMSRTVFVNCLWIQKLFYLIFLKYIWNLPAFDLLNLQSPLILCLLNFFFFYEVTILLWNFT